MAGLVARSLTGMSTSTPPAGSAGRSDSDKVKGYTW